MGLWVRIPARHLSGGESIHAGSTAHGSRNVRTTTVVRLTALAPLAPAAGLPAQEPCCRAEGLDVADHYRVQGLDSRRFTHGQYTRLLEPVTRSDRMRVTPLGQSVEGREIRGVSFGTGEVTVLLWSQMHGDESTATMALADILRWVAESPAPC